MKELFWYRFGSRNCVGWTRNAVGGYVVHHVATGCGTCWSFN